jgi:hypothetical protein
MNAATHTSISSSCAFSLFLLQLETKESQRAEEEEELVQSPII